MNAFLKTLQKENPEAQLLSSFSQKISGLEKKMSRFQKLLSKYQEELAAYSEEDSDDSESSGTSYSEDLPVSFSEEDVRRFQKRCFREPREIPSPKPSDFYFRINERGQKIYYSYNTHLRVQKCDLPDDWLQQIQIEPYLTLMDQAQLQKQIQLLENQMKALKKAFQEMTAFYLRFSLEHRILLQSLNRGPAKIKLVSQFKRPSPPRGSTDHFKHHPAVFKTRI